MAPITAIGRKANARASCLCAGSSPANQPATATSTWRWWKPASRTRSASSSLALFFDRRAGRSRESEIARLERAYPLIAGLHRAHVTCLMVGSCDLEDEVGAEFPKARPIRILDRAKQEVFQNAAWQRLGKRAAKSLAAALAKLPRAASPPCQPRLPVF